MSSVVSSRRFTNPTAATSNPGTVAAPQNPLLAHVAAPLRATLDDLRTDADPVCLAGAERRISLAQAALSTAGVGGRPGPGSIQTALLEAIGLFRGVDENWAKTAAVAWHGALDHARAALGAQPQGGQPATLLALAVIPSIEAALDDLAGHSPRHRTGRELARLRDRWSGVAEQLEALAVPGTKEAAEAFRAGLRAIVSAPEGPPVDRIVGHVARAWRLCVEAAKTS